MADYRRFLVAYDFSVHSKAALYAATDLARRLEADLHLLHVIQPPSYAFAFADLGAMRAPAPAIDLAEIHEDAVDSLMAVARLIENPPAAVHADVVEGDSIAAAIQEVARKTDADLIVMGTHGRTGLSHVFLGSVAERTLRSAPCPVLTIQGHEDAAQ